MVRNKKAEMATILFLILAVATIVAGSYFLNQGLTGLSVADTDNGCNCKGIRFITLSSNYSFVSGQNYTVIAEVFKGSGTNPIQILDSEIINFSLLPLYSVDINPGTEKGNLIIEKINETTIILRFHNGSQGKLSADETFRIRIINLTGGCNRSDDDHDSGDHEDNDCDGDDDNNDNDDNHSNGGEGDNNNDNHNDNHNDNNNDNHNDNNESDDYHGASKDDNHNDSDDCDNQNNACTDTLISGKIHLSCSEPIDIGNVYGDFEIIDINKILKGLNCPLATINLLSPGNNSIINKTNINKTNVSFEYDTYDANQSIDFCELIVDGTINQVDYSITEGVPQSFNANLTEGNHTWSVNCTNSNGYESSSETWHFQVITDQMPPQVSLIKPPNASYDSNGEVWFRFNVTSNSTIDYCRLNINQTVNATMFNVTKNIEQTFYVTGLSEGTIDWSVNCTDIFGNTGSSETWVLMIDFPEGASNTTLFIDETIEDAEGNFINATIKLVDLGSGETDVETSSGVIKNISAGSYNIQVTPINSNVQSILLTNISIITDIYEVIDLDYFETTEYDFTDGYAVNAKIGNYTSIEIVKTAVTGDPFICKNWNFTTATCIDGLWKKIGNFGPGENYTLTLYNDTIFGIIESNYTVNLLTQDLYFIPNAQVTINETGTIVDVLIKPYNNTKVFIEGRLMNLTILSHNIINISNDLIVEPFDSVAFPDYLLMDPTPLNFINATITRIAGPTSATLWKCPLYNFTEDICQVDLVYLTNVTANESYSYTLPANDPVFIEQPADASGVDSFIDKNTANTNYGVSAEMRIDDRSSSTKRPVIQWNVSAVPPKAKITSAVMETYLFGGWGANITSNVVRITNSWNESAITWNNQPSYDATIYSSKIISNNTQWYSWNITDLFKSWHNGTYQNYGLFLKASNETTGILNAKRFYTSDHSNASLRPRLSVAYPDLPPTINSPPDQVVDLGQLSTIDWIMADDILPGYYSVKRNNSLFVNPTTWIDNATTLVYPNNYFLGTWNYTIHFNDSIGNNGTPDTVMVTVIDNSTPNCNESLFNPSAPTLANIIIDGNVSDWDAVLANPKNYMADLTEAAGDLDDVETADRDLVGFAYTWDSQKLYFYFKRLTTGNRQVSMIVYIDHDLDGYMNSTDKAVKFVWQGTTRLYDSALYNYVPAGTADLMNGSGYNMPGSITINKTLETNVYGGTNPGIILEARVNWTSLDLPGPKPLNFQTAAARGAGTNLPSQLEDNVGIVNSKYADLLFRPNHGKATTNGTSVYYAHDLMNCGNLPDVIDLTNLSSQGWNVTLYHPNGSLIIDSNSNNIPDVRLGVTNFTTIIAKIDVPVTAAIGTVDITNITAWSFIESFYTKSVIDTTSIGQIAIAPNQRIISGTQGMLATLNYTVYNYQGAVDTIEINAVSSQGWSPSISYINGSIIGDTDGDSHADLGSFLPGQSKNILLRFLIPANATYGTVDLTTIRINSSANPTLTTTAAASTTVKPRITLEPDYNRSVGIGDSTYYYLTIGHNWNASDTIDLTHTYLKNYLTQFFKVNQVTFLTDTDADSKVDTGIIGPYGSEYNFYAKVTVPSNASEGESERTVVYANSSINVSFYDTATLNTTARVLITYLDASRVTEENIFEIGDIIYARAHSLIGINKVYFEWIDPNATMIRVSPDILVSSEKKADDQLNSNLSMLLGEWTIVVFNEQNNAELGRTTFYLVDSVPPNVIIITPAPGTNYNLTDVVPIAVNATDDLGIDTVLANLTWDATYKTLTLVYNNLTGLYQGNFTNTSSLGRFNITIIANDTSNNVNNAETTYFNVIDLIPPVINGNIIPAGTGFNDTEPVHFLINVTDNYQVDAVLANITMPNGTSILVQFNNTGGDIYEFNFNPGGIIGIYNATFILNDTSNNINATRTTSFRVNIFPYIIDVIDRNRKRVDYSINVLQNTTGILDVEIFPVNHIVQSIRVISHDQGSDLRVIKIDQYTNDEIDFNGSYSISLDELNYTAANYTIRSTGYHLFKCVNFSFPAQSCIDTDDYQQIETGLITGQNYTFPYNKTDPIFGMTLEGPLNTTDARYRSGLPNDNYGGSTFMRVGRRTAGNIHRSIIKFDLSYLPVGINITQANLSLYAYRIPGTDNVGVRTHGVHKVQQSPARDWTELNATWNSYDGTSAWTTGGGDYNATPTDTQAVSNTDLNSRIKYDVTSDVNNFVDNLPLNFGWIIIDESETMDDYRYDYRSSEHTNQSQWPLLEIAYVDDEPPKVFDLLPAAGSNYNVSDVIEIGANVTDNFAVDFVYATINFPNGTSQNLTLNNLLNDWYNISFVVPNATGQYNITFTANDTSNNVNKTETTYFNVLGPPPPIVLTAAGYKCTVTVSPKVAEAGEQVLLQADITYNGGSPATTLNITSANISTSKIIGSGITFISSSNLTYISPGIWYTEFNTTYQAYGNYMAIVNAIINNDPLKQILCSEVFTLFGRGNFDIQGVSPDLMNVNETTRLAAEIKYNGEPVSANLISNANLFVQMINGSNQTFSPTIENGVIYADGAFNETGVYYLDWSATYYNLSKTAREIVVVVDWGDKLDNINVSVNLNTTELIQLIQENRQYLLELLVNMEYLQQFTEEEVFLITDSVNSMTDVLSYLETGQITDEEASQQFERIRKELIDKLGDKITGSAITEEIGGQKTIFEKISEDWRATMFVLLLLIFGVLVIVVLLVVKMVQMTNKMQGQPKIQPSETKPMKRVYIVDGNQMLNQSTAANPLPKRRIDLFIDWIKENFQKKESFQKKEAGNQIIQRKPDSIEEKPKRYYQVLIEQLKNRIKKSDSDTKNQF